MQACFVIAGIDRGGTENKTGKHMLASSGGTCVQNLDFKVRINIFSNSRGKKLVKLIGKAARSALSLLITPDRRTQETAILTGVLTYVHAGSSWCLINVFNVRCLRFRAGMC